MTRVLYLLGAPGSGKTTLAETLVRLAGWHSYPVDSPRLPFVAHSSNLDGLLDPPWEAVSLGRHNPPFSGTDTLSWSIIDRAEVWVKTAPAPLVIGEGDRLATERFLAFVPELVCVYLDTPAEVAASRRYKRAQQHGLKTQNPQWVQGRMTKHQRLADQFDAHRLNGRQAPETLATEVLSLLGIPVA